jgi:hypothetical protein
VGGAAGHYHDPDDSVAVERQADCEVTFIRDFAGFTPASDLMRLRNDVALNFLELRLCLFDDELLVSARLLKRLSARADATKSAARRHGFDIGIKQRFGRVQVMRDDSLDELACPSELHRRNLVPTNAIFKLAPIVATRASQPSGSNFRHGHGALPGVWVETLGPRTVGHPFPLRIARRRQTAAPGDMHSVLLRLGDDGENVGLGAAAGVVDHFGDHVNGAKRSSFLAAGHVRERVYFRPAGSCQL